MAMHALRKRGRSMLPLCSLVALTFGCSGGNSPAAIPNVHELSRHRSTVALPKYVIVLVQENRSVDNLFQTQPGVDTQNFGRDSHHNRIPLAMVDLNVQYDCDHSHQSFVADVNVGFDTEPFGNRTIAEGPLAELSRDVDGLIIDQLILKQRGGRLSVSLRGPWREPWAANQTPLPPGVVGLIILDLRCAQFRIGS